MPPQSLQAQRRGMPAIDRWSAPHSITTAPEVLRPALVTPPSNDDMLQAEVFPIPSNPPHSGRDRAERLRPRFGRARLTRLCKAYLTIASSMAGLIGGAILTIQYFLVLPPFAWLARRMARREQPGWTAIPPQRDDAMRGQY